MSFSLIKLQKSKKCYECDEKRKTGKKFYCERCNESHFICKDCIPTYLEYEKNENSQKIDSVLETMADSIQNKIDINIKNDFSDSIKKEFR